MSFCEPCDFIEIVMVFVNHFDALRLTSVNFSFVTKLNFVQKITATYCVFILGESVDRGDTISRRPTKPLTVLRRPSKDS